MTGRTVVVSVDITGGNPDAEAWAGHRAALESGRVVKRPLSNDEQERGSVLFNGPAEKEFLTERESFAGADLVVVAAPQHRHLGWRRSACRRLLTNAGAPVVVVPSHARVEGPVVVGVDGTDRDRAATATGAHEALLRGVPLVLVHAWSGADALGYGSLDPLEDELDALLLLDRVAARHLPHEPGQPADASLLPLHGAPVERLRACSASAQLLVVGRGGHHTFGLTTAELLVRAGPACAVLATD